MAYDVAMRFTMPELCLLSQAIGLRRDDYEHVHLHDVAERREAEQQILVHNALLARLDEAIRQNGGVA